MSDTQNKWIPVSERLPDDLKEKLVRTTDQVFRLAYVLNGKWRDPDVQEDLDCVTHWMDLPEPPKTPKPADPFEAWWEKSDFYSNEVRERLPKHIAARAAWNAAKEHYAKTVPDFETWWNKLEPYTSCKVRRFKDVIMCRDLALSIWNAAQGKPEA